MIVLNVSYQCKPGMRDEFLKMIMAEGIDIASRADDGNLKYEYYIPAPGGDELLLVEKWTDAGALSEQEQQLVLFIDRQQAEIRRYQELL